MVGNSQWLSNRNDRVSEARARRRAASNVVLTSTSKSWELCAAMSLARLWRDQGHGASPDLLAPVYGWATEGFDTRDLKEAKLLRLKGRTFPPAAGSPRGAVDHRSPASAEQAVGYAQADPISHGATAPRRMLPK